MLLNLEIVLVRLVKENYFFLWFCVDVKWSIVYDWFLYFGIDILF